MNLSERSKLKEKYLHILPGLKFQQAQKETERAESLEQKLVKVASAYREEKEKNQQLTQEMQGRRAKGQKSKETSTPRIVSLGYWADNLVGDVATEARFFSCF